MPSRAAAWPHFYDMYDLSSKHHFANFLPAQVDHHSNTAASSGTVQEQLFCARAAGICLHAYARCMGQPCLYGMPVFLSLHVYTANASCLNCGVGSMVL